MTVTQSKRAGLAVLVLLLASCNWESGGRDYKWVDHDLRGTWEHNDPTSRIDGQLVLDYETITITGIVAHLRGFTRNIALKAYTEDAEDSKTGLLYIKDRGIWQSPVSYRRWKSAGHPKVEMLTLPAAGSVSDETFKRIED
ncbi:MAG: hypothetical protein LBP27_05310 [Treponema sp.]|jgi:hypothetical protein|nr:hypothetical protein [Treponema sp.]